MNASTIHSPFLYKYTLRSYNVGAKASAIKKWSVTQLITQEDFTEHVCYFC
jgi:hypothetical protein